MYLRLLFLSFFNLVLIVSGASNTFYIDPIHGDNNADGTREDPWKTLEYIVSHPYIQSYSYVLPYNPKHPQLQVKNSGAPIQAGDTIILRSGLHGSLFLRGYVNTSNITIMAEEGQTPILKEVHLIGCKNWVLDGLTVSGEPYREKVENLVFFESHNWHGPVSNLVFKNGTVFSAEKPWTRAEDWLKYMGNGIRVRGDSILIENNQVKNINFGITATGYYIRAINNTITNFAGDGMRVLTTRGEFRHNLIRNCYKVNDNHDDGIQSYTTGGLKVDSNIISGNTILNYSDPNQPLLGPLQGIGCFDGPYNDWVIENNVVIVDHWHGISLYGARRCTIINNTVLDPTPLVKPGPCWIKIESHKNGRPSTDCIVKNNISNTLALNANNTRSGNNQLFKTREQYHRNFKDVSTFDVHLLKNSICIDQADDVFAPKYDLDNTPRPQGQHADIGAYEYALSTSAFSSTLNRDFSVFPNPSSSYLMIEGPTGEEVHLYIWDLYGHLLQSHKASTLPSKIRINKLERGTYILLIDKLTNSDSKYFFFQKE